MNVVIRLDFVFGGGGAQVGSTLTGFSGTAEVRRTYAASAP